MCWIGRRKGRVGGNPGSVHKSDGDLPSAIETGGGTVGRKDLIAVLTGNAKHGRSKPTAPWKSGGLSGSMPGPRSAGISGEPRRVQAELPSWVKVDAHLCYSSRSTGKVVEVVVEMVNHNKCEVEITFAEDSKVWKVIPFSFIASDSTPLLGPWPPGSGKASKDDLLRQAQHSKPDKAEMIRRLQESSAPALEEQEADAPSSAAVDTGSRGGGSTGSTAAEPRAIAQGGGSGGDRPTRPGGAELRQRSRSRSRECG